MQRLMIVRDGAKFTAYGQEYNITAGHEVTVNPAIASRLLALGVAVPALYDPNRRDAAGRPNGFETPALAAV